MFAEGVKSKARRRRRRQIKGGKKTLPKGSEKHFGTERQRDERNCGERNAGTHKNPAKT